MNRRSRKGCIDCKRAKVKCDEVRPTCGTCYRRGYVCQGYASPPFKDPSTIGHDHEVSPRPIRTRDRDSRKMPRRRSELQRNGNGHPEVREKQSSESDSDAETTVSGMSGIETRSPSQSVSTPTMVVNSSLRRLSTGASNNTVGFPNMYPLYSNLPQIPPGSVQRVDEPGIETYFSRHPAELVISMEFVDEMNANILQVFQQDPATIAESLSAIGQVYLGEGGRSIVPFLDRRARILAKLRDKTEVEQTLVMHLCLCALELIDSRTRPADMGIPTLIANAAIIIKHNYDSGRPFGGVAKYFIRALARQDMMIALTYARKPLISTTTWLEVDLRTHPDRFMGYTGPLMPILSDLAALAEEIRGASTPTPWTPYINRSGEIWSEDTMMLGSMEGFNIMRTATDIRVCLDQWRPATAANVSFQKTRNLLFHAHAHKAAAILYLHRLLYAPGTSDEADKTALGMAHEVLMHLSAMTDQLKTALWPALIAGVELVDKEDRKLVIDLFDKIYAQRKTITSSRTKEFCINRVWTARDSGQPWHWMDLVHQYPGECLPI